MIPSAKTVVVRVKVYAAFTAAEDYLKICRNPRGAFKNWLERYSIGGVQDSWGWAEEKWLGPYGRCVAGRVRINDQHKMSILRASGSAVWFAEAISWRSQAWDDPDLKFHTEWVDKQVDETDIDYRTRCTSVGADLGLTVGRRQIGRRVAGQSPKRARRMWVLEEVPRRWTDTMVIMALGSDFVDIEVVRRVGRGLHTSWWFKAVSNEDLDMVAINYADEDEDEGADGRRIWARLAAAPVRGRQCRDIKHLAGSTDFLESWVDLPVQQEEKEQAQAGSPPDYKVKPESECCKGEATEKKVAHPVRVLPDDVTVTRVLGDGNCLFGAMALGVTRLRTHGGRYQELQCQDHAG